jgi:hypothetical protein
MNQCTAVITNPKATKRALFPAYTRPTRVGVYLVTTKFGKFWRFWDGENWRFGTTGVGLNSPRFAELCELRVAHEQNVKWYGLVEDI